MFTPAPHLAAGHNARQTPLRTFGLTLALSWACSGQADEPGHAHWAYRGPHDAAHWAEIDPDFKGCKTGHQQSPIDIRHAVQA